MADDHLTKTCGACGSQKKLSEFYRHSSGGYRGKCKVCMNAAHVRYVGANSEAVSDYKKRWRDENIARLKEAKRRKYEQNSEHIKQKAAEYSKANPERVKSYKTKWKRGNRHKTREYRFVRGQAQRQATPPWASRGAMVAIYRKARELTKATGVEHHVDHIIPVCSALVCGLHCEQNMQILEARANISKLNRWWPDMWM